MNDGLLSQEEIDALLRGESIKTETQETKAAVPDLSNLEKDALGEIGNIAMGTSATTLSTLLRQKVSITTPRVSVVSGQSLQESHPLPYLVVEVRYVDGLTGSNILVVKKEDAAVIADLMMGGDGKNITGDLDEIRMSAVGEAMNQMMGSSTTSLSSMFNMKIDITPPTVTLIDFGTDDITYRFGQEYDVIVKISFRMMIGDLVDSEIMQLIPVDAARNMVNLLMGSIPDAAPNDITESIPSPGVAPSPEPVREVTVMAPSNGGGNGNGNTNVNGYYGSPDILPGYERPSAVRQEPVAVKPAQFVNLSSEPITHDMRNIGLILDVPLEISVELGRTKKTIKEILELGPGSIIQLDKMAGEPVDILVNGKLIAKGEVVVIDESYGVRINTIISPMDRVNKLQ